MRKYNFVPAKVKRRNDIYKYWLQVYAAAEIFFLWLGLVLISSLQEALYFVGIFSSFTLYFTVYIYLKIKEEVDKLDF